MHPSFSQGLSPQSMSMSLNTAVPTQALHQSQPPNLTLFGSATNLQGKGTTPLTHIGLVPSTAMLHLARQSQEQAGLVLPQNHFNQGKMYNHQCLSGQLGIGRGYFAFFIGC